jgi:hypothetical protein
MPIFTVKERDQDKPCFLAAEGFGLTVELKGPANIEHARKVAKFLNEHIRNIEVETGTIELQSEGRPQKRIGGKRISLLS